MLIRIKSSNKIAIMKKKVDDIIYYVYPNEKGLLCTYIDNVIQFKSILGGNK